MTHKRKLLLISECSPSSRACYCHFSGLRTRASQWLSLLRVVFACILVYNLCVIRENKQFAINYFIRHYTQPLAIFHLRSYGYDFYLDLRILKLNQYFQHTMSYKVKFQYQRILFYDGHAHVFTFCLKNVVMLINYRVWKCSIIHRISTYMSIR